MDRTLKVYTKTDHLFAEFVFRYDHERQANAHYTQYRRLYNDDEEDEGKSVYPGFDMDIHLQYREFDSIDQIKAHDIEVVKNNLGRDMTDPRGYTYVYDTAPVLLRYVVANHIGCIGMVNVLFSFIDNTKEVKFLSATNPRFDFDLTSNSLETNVSCILKIPVYTDRDISQISTYDLKRLPEWY
ncbi:hypothetical protein [Flavobacterium humi]|uniref:Uncharacterized protein n=1 Tax=Flavobacterium humi TaxID=2562683 RepID=A0A4Z0L7F9_9FLAO|nr:hypothetical protein [Flavobacterium humi]TGD57952.1 hypothetical protein E4635_08040 [Flavobacterium humi]